MVRRITEKFLVMVVVYPPTSYMDLDDLTCER
jgi:hypothetical protein